MKAALPAVLLVLTGIVLLAHGIALSRARGPIDLLAADLDRVKGMIDPGTRLSFVTSLDDSITPFDDDKTRLYFQAQFCLVPAILEKGLSHHTVLIIDQGISRRNAFTRPIDTLYCSKNVRYDIMLVTFKDAL
jgi:hypothetical protein